MVLARGQRMEWCNKLVRYSQCLVDLRTLKERANPSQRSRTPATTIRNQRPRGKRTSSNGLVSGQQLSHTSLTTRSASSLDLQFGFASTDRIARRRTHACEGEGTEGQLRAQGRCKESGTYLMLLCEVPVPPGELAAESAVAREVLGPDLPVASGVAQSQHSALASPSAPMSTQKLG